MEKFPDRSYGPETISGFERVMSMSAPVRIAVLQGFLQESSLPDKVVSTLIGHLIDRSDVSHAPGPENDVRREVIAVFVEFADAVRERLLDEWRENENEAIADAFAHVMEKVGLENASVDELLALKQAADKGYCDYL